MRRGRDEFLGTRGLDEAVFVCSSTTKTRARLRTFEPRRTRPPDRPLPVTRPPGDRAGPSGGEAGLGPGAREMLRRFF